MKIFRFLLTIFHLVILVLLLATSLNSVVSPQKLPYLNLLSLAFPAFMILNAILCFGWLLARKRRVVLFFCLSLFLINPTVRWLNWTSKSKEVPNLKIVSFNIKAAQMGREKIYDYLENSGADVILGQEFGSEFNIPNYENRTKDNALVATNSKTEILNIQNLNLDGKGSAVYTDIKINGKIIRVFNIYLNPFSFEKQKLKPSKDLKRNEGKLKYAVRTLIPIFKIHQQEIAVIREAIDSSPYPVIVAGDFNSVPNSYEYYELGKGLVDAFVAKGRGNSASFHDYKFPIRIDFIFVSKEVKTVRYKVDNSVKMSDHFPVIAEFRIE